MSSALYKTAKGGEYAGLVVLFLLVLFYSLRSICISMTRSREKLAKYCFSNLAIVLKVGYCEYIS